MSPTTISANSALVYTMVIVSASDSDMPDSELKVIGNIVRTFPAFDNYDEENIIRDAENCAAVLGDDGGADTGPTKGDAGTDSGLGSDKNR